MAISETFETPPIAPSSTDKTNFRVRYDAFLAYIGSLGIKLINFVTQLNSTEANINAKEVSCNNASASAAASANFKGTWNSATAYALGESVLYNSLIYRSLATGTNKTPTTNPSYWTPVAPSYGAISETFETVAGTWYRIAVSPLNVGVCDATFKVKWINGNHRGVAQFAAGIMLLNPSIEQLFYRAVNTGVTRARIVYNTAYINKYAYLEVLVSGSLNFKIDIEMRGATGWTLLAPSTLGEVPEGYTENSVVFRSPIPEGTFPKVTFNQNGRITAGSALVSADIPSSVALAGVPTAPTAANGTNTTQLATTAFAYGMASKAANGYLKLPNGLIMQWGSVAANTSVTFPIAFPTAALFVLPQIKTSDNTEFGAAHVNPISITTTGFSRTLQTLPVSWFAIGY